jgi:hypothetical protein
MILWLDAMVAKFLPIFDMPKLVHLSGHSVQHNKMGRAAREIGYLHSEVGNHVSTAPLKVGRIVQNMVA